MSKVGHTDIEGADTKELGTLPSFSVKAYRRAAAAQLHYFHLTPGNAVYTSAKGFADRFLCCKASSKTVDLPSALHYFSLSEDTLKKTFAVMLKDLAHAVDLDDVNAHRNVDS
jgi:hypothetical protein